MNKNYLAEAFKSLQELDILNEEDFRLDKQGAEEAQDFIDNDEAENVEIVIDPEAETEEELKDSYIGNVILECCVCHTKLYKQPDDVVISEEADLANIDEECPFCYSTDGYKIIGQVAPFTSEGDFEAEEAEDKVEDEVADDIEVKVDDEDVEEVNEGLLGAASAIAAAHPVATALGAGAIGGAIGSALNQNEELEEDELKEDGNGVLNGNTINISANDNKVPFLGGSIGKKNEDLDDKNSCDSAEECEDDSCTEKKVDEALQENFEKVEIETDNQKMSMTQDENGKVVVETEPKEVEEVKEAEEVIAPVKPEVEQEIKDRSAEAAEEDEEDSELEYDFDDFDEENFDELGESYLKNIYENVNSFKTAQVSTKGNKLTVEGIISFNSGKEKKTTFIFEAKDATKDGRVRFIGENCQICKGKKAFTVTGAIKENKLIAESLNYNYRTKNAEGKSTRLYGTVRVGK